MFTYTINDGRGGAATASITLQNALPIASNESVHPSTGLVRLDVLQLGTPDVDPDRDALFITAVTNGTHGTASTDGVTVTYTPGPGYHGNDVFTYTINDGRGRATASITLQNALPIASNESVHPSTGLVRLDVLQLGTPDVDPDGDALLITAVTNGTHGTASTDGVAVTYTPGPGYDGNDVFTYTINDGRGGAATGTVTLQNALPIAADDLCIR